MTNDDGVSAPGLRALVEAVQEVGEVCVVAPHQERSGAAQSLTLRHPIISEQVGEREWSIEGTPADAMLVALGGLLPERPDLVISGINRGGNLGENIFYSGTVGAAVEATIHGVASFAISVAYPGPNPGVDYGPAARFARQLAELILARGLPEDVLLNVNIPIGWQGEVRFTRQSKKVTRNVLQEGVDPRGRTYYWLSDQKLKNGFQPDSDYAAIFAGAASVTPIQLDRTHELSLNHLSSWAALLSPPRGSGRE